MFQPKLKTRRCQFRKCRESFPPQTDWQKYCCPLHRETEKRMKRRELLRRAQRLLDAHEKQREAGAA